MVLKNDLSAFVHKEIVPGEWQEICIKQDSWVHELTLRIDEMNGIRVVLMSSFTLMGDKWYHRLTR